MIKSECSNINGVIVVRNGYIAYERYFNGFGPNDTYHMASVTKSIISAIIGIIIDAGFIKNVDQKVLDFFPEYIPNPFDTQKQEITIRHLLTMTAPYPFEDWHEPLDKMCMQSDWVKYILNILGQKGSIGALNILLQGRTYFQSLLLVAQENNSLKRCATFQRILYEALCCSPHDVRGTLQFRFPVVLLGQLHNDKQKTPAKHFRQLEIPALM